ncbi:PAS domain-containing protein [Idiomarina seosinensis]|uniref:GGDEF domain-containing protein n=1 Tax=Idiomarina seosinensis TaxID=281739 RepID=UPI00384C802C
MSYGQYQNLPLTDRLLTMLEATQAGTWEWNVQTGECNFNGRWADIIGYTLDELQPVTIDTWMAHAHPDDLGLSEKKLQEHFDGIRDFYECEARMQHKQGHWVWVRDYGKLVSRTEAGEPEWVVGTHIDVSALKELSQRFEAFADLLPGVLYQYQLNQDGSSCFPFASSGLADIYGVTPEQVKSSAEAVFKVIHPDDLEHVAESIAESAAQGSDWTCEYRVILSGRESWVYGHARPQKTFDGGTLWYGMIIDITQRKQLELALKKSQATLTMAQDIARFGHWEANLATGELRWSDMIYTILDYQPGEISVSVERFQELVHPDDLEEVLLAHEKANETGTLNVEHRMLTRSGSVVWVQELAELQEDGQTLIGTVRDITEQKKLQLQLQRQATVDPLTQISNRRRFKHALTREFNRFQRYQTPLTLLMFDLDHFKKVNDTYGHSMGDQVLIQLTRALKLELREQDIFARIGGEEFAILLTDTGQQAAYKVAEKLRAMIAAEEIHYQNNCIHVSATFGLVTLDGTVGSEEHLLQIADRALYKGKESGRNCVIVADTSLY